MPDFGLLQTPNFAQAALGGYQAGRKIGQERRMDQALQLYAKDPDAGVSAITAIDPEKGESLRKVAQDRRASEAASKVFQPSQAATGALGAAGPQAGGLQVNPEALNAYARIDPEGALKFQQFASKATEDQFKQVQSHLVAKGQAADYLLKIPEGPERAAEFQRMLPQLQSMGFRPEDLAQANLSTAMLSRDALAGHTFGEQTALQKDYGFLNSVEPGLGDTYARNKATPLIPVKGEDENGNETLTFMQRPSAGSPGASPGAAQPSSGSPSIVSGNNHGAIKDGPFARSQPGYTGSQGGFATFKDAASGNAAQERLLDKNYLSKGYDTPSEIVRKYAPLGKENSASSVNNYIGSVARSLGIGPDDQITPAQLPTLAKAMRSFETGGKSDRAATAAIAAPKSRADYDRLAPGTPYIAPDGTHKVKG